MSQCRNQLREVWAAHWVEDDACALAISDTHHFLQHVDLFRRNHMCCSGFEQSISFCRRTRECNGSRPGIVDELNSRKANTAGRGRNDDEIALGYLSIQDNLRV